MIVKDESHIIRETLEKLCEKINFDYWVISDTGSTDDTPNIIKEFFKEKNIDGELYFDEWKNFAYNRTLALEYAYQKTDYLLVFDADDEIYGDFKLPSILDHDAYQFCFGGIGIKYGRILLVNNKKKFNFLGVLHEYMNFADSTVDYKLTYLEGDYYVISGRKGSRNKDPQKYLKDALILEKAYEEEFANKNDIYKRYAFYCGNSYYDYNDKDNALTWYKKTLEVSDNNQEKYVSAKKIYEIYKEKKQEESGLAYLVMGIHYDNQRCECVYPLIMYYVKLNMFDIAYNYFCCIRNLSNISYPSKILCEPKVYEYDIPNIMIYVGGKLGKKDLIDEMYRVIFTKKFPCFTNIQMRNLLINHNLFTDFFNQNNKKQLELFNGYIEFLTDKKINIEQYENVINKSRFYLSIDENYKITNNNKNNVLIYVGNSPFDWNLTYMESNAIGGSEFCAGMLAKKLSKYYNVFILGKVKHEIVDNIYFIDITDDDNTITKNFLLETTKFEFTIVSRFLDFFKVCYNIKTKNTYLWAHDCAFAPTNDSKKILEQVNNRFDYCVCLTEWHKSLFMQNYPSLVNKIKVIGNGLVIDEFPKNTTKIKNRFIYTSASERGLVNIVKRWNEIKIILPDAELHIASYNKFPNENKKEDAEICEIMKNHDSIKHLGKLNKKELYDLMATAEFWFYPTVFPETFCITAMEMLKSGVICIYYPYAGLINTIGKYGFPVSKETELEAILQISSLSENEKDKIRNQGIEYANSTSWQSKVKEWVTLHLSTNNILPYDIPIYNNFPIKIINLKRREDRKILMEKNLKQQNVLNYEFIEAVDGKELSMSDKIFKLFNRNNFDYKKGVIGVIFSNINIFYNMLINNNDYCVILEDDIELCDDFKEKLDYSVGLFLKSDYDVMSIGENFTKRKINEKKENLNLEKNSGTHIFVFAYVIKQKFALDFLEFIRKCSIKCAIDDKNSFGNIMNCCILNELLVKTEVFNIDGTDSDIQSSNDNFIVGKKTDKIIKTISYCDWWTEEYDGGIFNYEQNFLTLLLEAYGDNIKLKLINPHENPDILFFSSFGNTNERFSAKNKIFYTGESLSKNTNASYNLTFDKNSINNARFPIWLVYLNNGILKKCIERNNNFIVPEKNKFCSFICSNDRQSEHRKEFVEKLSQYKMVDCGGPFMNNIGYTVPRGENCSGKIEHNKKYKFAIAFENKKYPGYVTEKILDCYKSNCIPIYWGCNEIIEDFNPSTFINSNNFDNFEDLVNYIIKVDNNDELYNSYFKEMFLAEYWINIFYGDTNKTFFKNIADNIVN
jgi:GR25 family glycosyltransferase involved in LPS biosynthesis